MTDQDSQSGGITRRRFVREAGVATVVAADALAGPTMAARPNRRARRRPTVVVFGGGVAGLTAAHELIERGFDVTVYERRAWGGKARSTEVPGSGVGGRRPLPGEHGARIIFGFEQNLPDTMRRIPFGSNPNGVFDNLVPLPRIAFARDGGRPDLVLPIGSLDPRPYTPQEVIDLVTGVLGTHLPPDAVAHLAGRIAVYLSSCDARRLGQWEHTTWTDFTASDRYGDDYRKIIVNFFSEFIQASKAERTSAQFSGHLLEWVIYGLLGFKTNGPSIRWLNLPTNEAFIDPWLAALRGLGVRLRNHHQLTGFSVRRGRIAGARVRSTRRASTVHADWYVCALPVERARRLWSPAILAADPHLGRMKNLSTDWMEGMKFFLRERHPVYEQGGVVCVDSPWQVTFASQAQFWPVDFASTYGDGRVRDCFTVIISNWNTPGVVYGKTARECTPEQVAREAWEQMKRHVNKPGRPPKLTDDLIVSWDIDPGMILRHDRLVSGDPLVLPTVGEGPDRPDVTTAIPNLLLVGDYLQSDWEVANMEAASYNARRAVNAILDKSGSRASPARAVKSYRPPEWEPLKRIDETRYKRGLPNIFDADLTPSAMRHLLGRPQTS